MILHRHFGTSDNSISARDITIDRNLAVAMDLMHRQWPPTLIDPYRHSNASAGNMWLSWQQWRGWLVYIMIAKMCLSSSFYTASQRFSHPQVHLEWWRWCYLYIFSRTSLAGKKKTFSAWLTYCCILWNSLRTRRTWTQTSMSTSVTSPTMISCWELDQCSLSYTKNNSF